MANIDNYLRQILSAIYGKDVRQSIHDSISAINNEVLNYNDYVKTALDGARKSEANALACKDEAANQANIALSHANKAGVQATNSANSASAAKTSETNAKTSETNAAESEKNVNDINTKLAILAESIQEKETNINELVEAATQKVANIVFSVDFETGELMYEDTGTYDFSINTETGYLEWTVI